MVYVKKNYTNNGECGLEFGFNETALVFFGAGAYDRFPTSDFIVEVTTFDPTQDNKVTARENIFCTSRSGNQFNVGVIGNRAYEAVPIDDDQTSNIQQALAFAKTNTVVKCVWSKKSIDDIQDELEALPTTYATKQEIKEGSLVYNASSTGNDDYNITISGVTSYIDGATYRFKADVANTSTATFEINSLGAITLKKNQGQDILQTGDIKAGGIVTATYNSTLSCFQFVGQVATVVSVATENTKSSVTAGEDVTAGDALYIDTGTYNCTTTSNITQNTGGTFQTGGTTGQTFTTLGTGSNNYEISSIDLNLGSSSGTTVFSLNIYDGPLKTTLLYSANDVVATQVGDKIYNFTFQEQVILDGNTQYFIEIEGDDNGERIIYANSNVYAGGSRYYNGIEQATNDIYFVINGFTDCVSNLGKAFKTDASDNTKINFVGFASETVTSGNPVSITTAGVNNNQSSLTIGDDYYLKDSTISTTDNSSLPNDDPNNENQYCGYRIYVNNNCTLTEVKQAFYTNATNCRLLNDGGTQLANVSVSGGIATFNYTLTAGTYYKIEMFNNSASFTARKTSPTLPVNGTNINYVSGSYAGVTNTSYIYNIEYIKTETAYPTGVIDNTPGTNSVKVGKAISATEIEIFTFDINKTIVNLVGYQSINNTTDTKVLYDTLLMGNFDLNNSRFTAIQGGLYKITNSLTTTQTTGAFNVKTFINGVDSGSNRFSAGGNPCTNILSKVLNLSAGDYVEFYVYQTSGGTTAIGGGYWENQLIIEKF